MECIVYFDVMHGDVVKELRGLIFLDEGKAPTEKDYLLMFEDMGYKLRQKTLMIWCSSRLSRVQTFVKFGSVEWIQVRRTIRKTRN